MQFGVGVEYEVWKAFKVGLDGYHLMANMTNTNNSYGQVGPCVGISFVSSGVRSVVADGISWSIGTSATLMRCRR